MRIILTNQEVHVDGGSRRALAALKRELSYMPEGAVFSDAFREKRWDGKIKLFRLSKRTGRHHAPAGLLDDILDILEHEGEHFELIDSRRAATTRAAFNFKATLFPHQEAAVDAILAPRGRLRVRGRGILRMAIRGGKTITFAAALARLGRRGLFLVNATTLLEQSQAALSRALGVKVGVIGGGRWEPGRELTVAMAQSLVMKAGGKRKIRGEDEWERVEIDPRLPELLGDIDVIAFDECHHLEAASYRAIIEATDCPFKIGLTATLNGEPKDMHLHGATGPILFTVTASELIRIGRLVRPDVRLIRYERPTPPGQKAISKWRKWSSGLRASLVDANEDRHRLVARAVRALLDEGLKNVVVHVRYLDHATALVEAIRRDAKVRVEKVIGPTAPKTRAKHLKALAAGKLPVIVSNVLGEGVDIPELEGVVNAATGSDPKLTMQRMRNLTPDPKRPDKRAVYVDIMDVAHLVTAEHAANRLEVYKSEPEFRIRTWSP